MFRIPNYSILALGGLLTLSVLCGYACSKAPSANTNGDLNTPLLTGWVAWNKTKSPVFSGQYPLVGDASVIKDGSKYRMFYTCFDPARSPQGPEICEALSSDGFSWNYAPTGNATVLGRILATGPGVWDTAHETSFMLRFGANYYLYFVGYNDRGGIYNSIPSSIGLAYAIDGLNFTRATSPLLIGTPRGYDADVITSPSIVNTGDGNYLMVYAGYCAANCDHTPGIYLLGATSMDGLSWTKLPNPLIQSTDIPWANQGLAEPEIIKGPDGYYYLFVTVLQGTNPQQIGIARSQNYTGPWQVNPQPILTAGGAGSFDEGEVLAPSVLIEGNKVKMWFHGVNKSKNAIAIGYAESTWPLYIK